MKVVFDLRRGKLLIDGDGPELLKVLEAARELAPDLSHIQIVTQEADDSDDGGESESKATEERHASQKAKKPTTLRSFARSLTLDNAAERISAIAYYANKIEGRHVFAPKDLDGWFTMCGFPKPKQMPVALFDTKRKYGYVENVARGAWKISNQGENVILAKIEDSGKHDQ